MQASKSLAAWAWILVATLTAAAQGPATSSPAGEREAPPGPQPSSRSGGDAAPEAAGASDAALPREYRLAQPPRAGETWYAIFLGDARLGRLRERSAVEGGKFILDSTMRFSMDRFGTPVVIEVAMRSVESLAGEPESWRMSMKMGPLTLKRQEIAFEPDKLLLTSYAGGRPRTVELDRPADLVFTPLATQRFIDGLLSAGRHSGRFTVIDTEGEALAANEVTIGGVEQVELIGRRRRLLHVGQRTRTAAGLVVTESWMDPGLQLLRGRMGLQSLQVDLVACDRDYALDDGGDGAFKVAQMTLPCPPGTRLGFDPGAPGQARRAVEYMIVLGPGAWRAKPAGGVAGAGRWGATLPTSDAQLVEKLSGGRLRLTVRLEQPAAAEPVRYRGDDAEVAARLRSTRYVEADDPQVAARAAAIVAGCDERFAAALAIEGWVRENIADAMDVLYDTAAATLASGRGDCTEHALLTAALCRAAGIPCRVVGGLVYTARYGELSHRFIGHAWNEVYAGGRWITVDAAWPASAPRIACTIGDGDPLAMVNLVDALTFSIEALVCK